MLPYIATDRRNWLNSSQVAPYGTSLVQSLHANHWCHQVNDSLEGAARNSGLLPAAHAAVSTDPVVTDWSGLLPRPVSMESQTSWVEMHRTVEFPCQYSCPHTKTQELQQDE